jgi:hypothetical protein
VCLAQTTFDLKEVATLAFAVAGGSFALWRWTVDQKWRRVQYAQSLIKEFLENKSVAKACEVIDTDGDVLFEIEGKPKKRRNINVSNKFLLRSFTTFTEKEENTYDEIAIRDVFDELFSRISVFQSHIDTGLIKLRDVRPYLEYWIKELSGHGNVHSQEVAAKIRKYLQFFGYSQVLLFARDMGYPFKEGTPDTSVAVKLSPDRQTRRNRKARPSRAKPAKRRNPAGKNATRKART